ncbi:MAG: hypothetical protein LCI00_06265 [Chloroflexi bacterium]|nr:hypothetical protein [Chloroflexota bacterium]MCC6891805.1 hypothetical protein [Anaerolineae bacterium]
MTVILALLTAVCLGFLIRVTLIIIGTYKEPIIKTFSEYGPDEKLYMPAQSLFLWTGILCFCGGLWATGYSSLSFTLSTVGVFLIFLVGASYTYPQISKKINLKLMRFPRWYHELRERTTRYERRRIGYMWLHLPLRARLTYNSSDSLFLLWADFVIMGTIREEEPNPRDEEFFYTGH